LTFGITVASTLFQGFQQAIGVLFWWERRELLHTITTDFEALQDLTGSEKQSVVDVYLRASRGVCFLTMAELILAAAITLAMKNNILSDAAKEQTDAMEMES